MADLTTYENIESELAATSDYDVERDVSKAKRHVAALRRKLHFASSSGRDGQSIQFDLRVLQAELDRALKWVAANESVSETDRTSNPSVLHADFSGFGQYGGRYSE